MKIKNNFMKHSIGTMVDTVVGGATMKVIGDSQMQPGFKQATQSLVGIGIVGNAYKRFGKTKW